MVSPNSSIFQTVVFATDFSIFSQNAGLYASLLARQFSATLLVSHAFYLSQPALEVEVMSHIKSMQRQDLEAYLARRVERLGGENYRSVPILAEGDPREEILRIAQGNPSPVIVMGTHGGNCVARGIIGSTAESIFRTTRFPCLTVGPRVPALIARPVPIQRLLYATEPHPAVVHAATIAVALAEEFHAKIDVLHVVGPEKIHHPGCFDKIEEQFYSDLDKLVPSQAKEFCTPRSFVEVGNAHVQILRHIEEYQVDLVVLGIRRSTHVWTSSRTSGVFHLIAHSPRPVLTVAD
ncbi:MAG TPA: universal stress protein [Candidatus Sulfotelmatobacter sp.]|nr:universal stress protein [Candidatus Sulfotelmatobacter sp.]